MQKCQTIELSDYRYAPLVKGDKRIHSPKDLYRAPGSDIPESTSGFEYGPHLDKSTCNMCYSLTNPLHSSIQCGTK